MQLMWPKSSARPIKALSQVMERIFQYYLKTTSKRGLLFKRRGELQIQIMQDLTLIEDRPKGTISSFLALLFIFLVNKIVYLSLSLG